LETASKPELIMNALLQIGLSNAVSCGIMAVLLLPLARLLRRPALTHALSVLILLKLVTPPVFSVPVIWNSTAASMPSQQTTNAETAPSLSDSTTIIVPGDPTNEDAPALADDATIESTARQSPVIRVAPPRSSRALLAEIWEYAGTHWRAWLSASWVTSAVLLGALTFARIIRLDLAVRRATTPGPDISQDIELLSGRLGLRRIPRVRFIAGAAPPMLLALLHRPELVIPIHLWDRLDRLQRQTLLLHELAHLNRGDHWVRYVELLATCAYWWHPAIWFGSSG
jgi:beta-lactamase regulating signal transducer with metallopeptidase domain